MNKFLAMLFAVLMLVGCDAITGEEVARLPINKTSNLKLVVKEATLQLKKHEKIGFWTEMDMEYEGDLALVYRVEVWKDSVKKGGFELNALKTNPTFNAKELTFGNKTSRSYSGKLDALKIEEDGKYTFRAAIMASDNSTLNLKKAELILKK